MAAITETTATARGLRVGLRASFALCLVALSSACNAELTGSSAAPGAAAGASSAGGGSLGSGGTAAAGSPGTAPVDLGSVVGVDPALLPDKVPANSRVLRLSYREYDHVLSDLLSLPVDESRNFPAEQPNLGPYVGYGSLDVNERLLTELDRSATSLAERVVTTPTAYKSVLGCEPTATGCRDQFIDGFGLRALRRPLSDSERARYQKIFDRGAELVGSGDAFRDGVQVTLQALLQSPKFLYRLEAGSGASDAAGTLLTGYELAARLSFMLGETTPDAELLAAAKDGKLATADGLAAQARRLVNSAVFDQRAIGFHERWMQLDELSSLAKDTQAFPNFSPALVTSMRAETEAFLRAVTLDGKGAVSDLLSARFGFVDQQLAPLYGEQGTFGSDLVRVDRTADSKRIGLFTQASFLAGHSSSSSGTSPILRGVFLMRRIACANIPDPPAGAAMQQPATQPATEIRTTRDYFTWKTSLPACTGCHSIINPTGFAFEHFDGLGQWRDMERDAPIDSTGTLTLGTKQLTFSDASQLLEQLAKEPQVQACYAKNWLQYAYGRPDVEADSRALGLAAQKLLAGNFSIRDLAVSLTERPAFNHLPPKAE